MKRLKTGICALLLAATPVACGGKVSELEGTSTIVAPLVSTQSLSALSFTLPGGQRLQAVAVGSRESLQVGDRARVAASTDELTGARSPALVVNQGTGATYIGGDAKTGGVWSRGAVDLRSRANVQGDVRTSSTVQKAPDATVSGTLSQQASIAPDRITTWTPVLPTGPGGNVQLEPDQTRSLSPGKYGEVSVKSRSRLTLAPGTYRFSRLTLESDSELILSSATEPTVIYLDGDFTFRGKVRSASNAPLLPLLVASVTQNQVNIEKPFLGTVFAPNARVVVIGGTHYGAFFGKQVELRPDATVVHTPFPWAAALPPTVVTLGGGNDTYSIFDLCEIVPGDTIDGGGGTDTLVTPVPVEQLAAGGTVVRNFENVVVQANSCRSECHLARTCSGHGTCVEGDELGETSCQCQPGYAGAACDQIELNLPTTNGPAPSLTGPGTVAQRIDTFIAWLRGATLGDLGSATQQIYAVHGDAALGSELVARFRAARSVDSSRALLILSLLGEMRTEPGHELFEELLAEPVPPATPETQASRGTQLAYQAKAVHGIGYLFTAAANQQLLDLAGAHPERLIRAEAIRTYAFNQGDAARETARAAARPEEQWFADRFENRDLDSGKTFDQRQAEFAAKHPELVQN